MKSKISTRGYTLPGTIPTYTMFVDPSLKHIKFLIPRTLAGIPVSPVTVIMDFADGLTLSKYNWSASVLRNIVGCTATITATKTRCFRSIREVLLNTVTDEKRPSVRFMNKSRRDLRRCNVYVEGGPKPKVAVGVLDTSYYIPMTRTTNPDIYVIRVNGRTTALDRRTGMLT